jgi:transcriptional regulator with XRE-family HTH domain
MPKLSGVISKRLKEYRKEHDLPQEQFAEKAGISLPLLSELERGIANPTLQTLEKIAHAMALSVAEMLDADCTLRDEKRLRSQITGRLEKLDADNLKVIAALLGRLKN